MSDDAGKAADIIARINEAERKGIEAIKGRRFAEAERHFKEQLGLFEQSVSPSSEDFQAYLARIHYHIALARFRHGETQDHPGMVRASGNVVLRHCTECLRVCPNYPGRQDVLSLIASVLEWPLIYRATRAVLVRSDHEEQAASKAMRSIVSGKECLDSRNYSGAARCYGSAAIPGGPLSTVAYHGLAIALSQMEDGDIDGAADAVADVLREDPDYDFMIMVHGFLRA